MYNDNPQEYRRRKLRKSQTEGEEILWQELRNRKLNGLKFRRQYGVGPYILDFFCSEARLAIELDGEQHRNKVEYDKERTEFLKDKDIKVLRFWNSDVIKDIKAVLKTVAENARV